MHGPRLFNALPSNLRDFTGSLDKFKNMLDTYLKSVPDKPPLAGYAQAVLSNSLLDRIMYMRY